jgi:hypothetical protein
MQLPSFSEITYVQLTTMAELLSQHKTIFDVSVIGVTDSLSILFLLFWL